LRITTDDVDAFAVHRDSQRRADGIRQARPVRFFVFLLSHALVATPCAFFEAPPRCRIIYRPVLPFDITGGC
jgi:hypothetical protein